MPESFSHESGIVFFVPDARLQGLAARLYILPAGIRKRATGLKSMCYVMSEHMLGGNRWHTLFSVCFFMCGRICLSYNVVKLENYQT